MQTVNRRARLGFVRSGNDRPSWTCNELHSYSIRSGVSIR